MLQYLDPGSKQTLLCGIREARAAEGDKDAASSVAPELLADIDMHDAIHVLFGCSTDLSGEILAHIWTVFGTTVAMRDMHRVTKHDNHRSALAQIGHRQLLRTWLRSLPRVAGTIVRARQMKRRWPADEFHAHLERPLDELRASFGIRVSTT